MQIQANGIDIEVEDSGADGRQADRPVVLLIMGLGMQLVAWPPQMLQALVDAGYRVIRFDNRDAGRSRNCDALGLPSLFWAGLRYRLRLPVPAPYSLQDMAQDALGVLDALQVPRAHVLGVSMGGMIAQRLALAAPERCLSLVSIMSSSGARGLPQARPEVMRALLARPLGSESDAVVQHYLRLFRVIGSPAFADDQEALRVRVQQAVQRGWNPAGTLRQVLAVTADTGRRAAQLGLLRLPTLVLHGKADPLMPYACAEDLVRRIPGACLVGIEGMGHDLPPGVVELLMPAILPFMAQAQARAR